MRHLLILPTPTARLCQLVAAALLVTACSVAATRFIDVDDYDLYTDVAGLTELSGLAASHRHPGVYWGHNDSGHSATLYRFNDRGEALGALDIDGADALDWEDMASFSDDQGHWLVIGDIGDNYAIRRYIEVYLLAEPESLSATAAPIKRRYRLRYPDGPRDAEALAVDPHSGHAYIVSKRDPHPRLYRFDLRGRAPGTITLELVGEVKSLPTPERHQQQNAGDISEFSPTGLAFDAGGHAALMVTLEHSYYFRRQAGEPWLDALNRSPYVLTPQAMPQTEAGAISVDGHSALVGSEGYPSPLSLMQLPRKTGGD
ncbi:esterase-like activity of phytase family protein [Spongiibacter nanhainus]|uniref:Esterase-like activity of phytase family protein n=1 Tax=Spongiibacter nanhainus TaxID=2794344 RepID=A0A7T4UQY6_9GAMM|nr:esterase-like activity of phytase family protein [Spongiibacter nanhainus]QQD18982.1 esterase-like activity of phytase family protein [Spongiibacter nanhainus]